MTFPPEVWSGVLRRLRKELPAFSFDAWIAPLVVGEAHEERVVLLCPTSFHRDRVRNTLGRSIAAAFTEALGRSPALEFDVASASAGARAGGSIESMASPRPAQGASCPDPGERRAIEAASETAPGAEHAGATRRGARPAPMRSVRPAGAAPGAGGGPLASALRQTTEGLRVSPHATEPQQAPEPRSGVSRTRSQTGGRRDPRRPSPGRRAPAAHGPARGSDQAEQPRLPYPYSFDNFVVGPCNALAREAAFAVAGGQAMPLKQLYLASPSGLGKTHLARAVAAEVARQNARPVRYASAEVFTSEFVSALRSKTIAEFKRRYRPERGGLLVLEDVQFLAAKKATQLEFFHSVQHVLDAGGRVLLTGDRMPQDMEDLDERVREQLGRGFVAGLEAPDALVRRQILKVKAANGAIALPDECLDLLVESVSGNVRELESVLMQVVTTSTLLKRPIDLELTKSAIQQKVQAVAPPAKRPEIADVLGVVASFFKTTPQMLAARSRRRAVLLPRQLAMYLCHRHTDASLAEIGRALDRDHPSVRNAIKKVEREMLESPRTRYHVEALTTRIQERTS